MPAILVGHLLLASQGPLLVVPALDELVAMSIPFGRLSDSEEMQVNALLGEVPATPRKSRLVRRGDAAGPLADYRDRAGVRGRPRGRTGRRDYRGDPIGEHLARTNEANFASLTGTRGEGAAQHQAANGFRSAHLRRHRAPGSGRVDLIAARWLAALGAIALLSFLVVNVLVWSSVKPPTTTPTAQRPRLLPVEDVTLTGGHKQEISLVIERHDCTEPLRIQVEGLPAGIKASALTLTPEQDTATLPLLAPLGGEPLARDVFVSLWQSGQRIEEHHFRLSVHPVACPVLLQPESIHCTAGTTFLFTGTVDRTACQEPLRLQFEGLPDAIGQESLPGRDADPPRMKLTVPADAKPMELVPVEPDAARRRRGRRHQAALFQHQEGNAGEVQLNKEKTPDSLSLKAGEKGELRVVVERGNYKGSVEIRLDGLPAGATARPVAIPADLSARHRKPGDDGGNRGGSPEGENHGLDRRTPSR